ncbi:MAG TPA: hypothetical protein VHT73_01790 [Thermodesulfobacteriota bacterium]|nr:hypothetical protein [Thermodesulfobacteriota bacterium]
MIGTRTSENIGAALNVDTFINVRAALDTRFQEGCGPDIIAMITRSSTGMALPQAQIIACVFQIHMTTMRQMSLTTVVYVSQLSPGAEIFQTHLIMGIDAINVC